jgi:hypothetical protein
LVLTGLFVLKYSSSITGELAVFGIIMLSAFYFKKYITEHEFVAIFAATIFLSTIFYAVIDHSFVVNNFNYFVLELVYNVLASIIFWLALDSTTKYSAS